jgi:hypothetical protein
LFEKITRDRHDKPALSAILATAKRIKFVQPPLFGPSSEDLITAELILAQQSRKGHVDLETGLYNTRLFTLAVVLALSFKEGAIEFLASGMTE